ncbi:MAG: hypothetical protein IIY06_08025 [Proteobacteria bacterium]|jgi:hypothetical protein|nr:hypothetical protein [Pseudomonadota bacterium]
MRETHFRAETAVSETQRIVMLNAYNNDIEYNKRWYHIQTEDNGLTNGHITTTVFHSGQTLDSKTISYLDFVKGISDENEINNIVKEKMTEQHKFFYQKLFKGEYEAQVAAIYKKSNQISKVPSASMPRVTSPTIAPAVHRSMPSINPPKSPIVQPVISAGKQDGGRSVLPLTRKQSGTFANDASHVAGLTKPLERSNAVAKASLRPANRPWAGVAWPKDDLSLDMLVANLLSGQSV